MVFPQFLGGLTTIPRRNASSGEKANGSGSFFQTGNEKTNYAAPIKISASRPIAQSHSPATQTS